MIIQLYSMIVDIVKCNKSIRYIIIVFASILFCVPHAFADNTKISDTVTVNQILDTSFLNSLPFDSALNLLKKATLFSENKHNDTLLSKVFLTRGDLFYNHSDYENAVINYKWAYETLNHYKKLKEYLKSILKLTNSFYFLNQKDSLLYYIKLGLSAADDLGNNLYKSRFIGKMGLYYEKKHDLPAALKKYHEALKLLKAFGKPIDVAREQINIGNIYFNSGDTNNSKFYYLKALAIGKKFKNSNIISASVNNLGDIYNAEKKYDSALIFMKQSLDIDRQRDDYYGIAASLINMASVKVGLKKFSVAMHYYKKSYNIAHNHKIKNLEALSIYNIGGLFMDSISEYYQLDSSIAYFEKALTISKDIKNYDYIRSALYILQNLYAKRKNYKKAFKISIDYQDINDSLFNKEKMKQLLALKAKYETEQQKKELLIAKQKAEKIKLTAIIVSLALIVIIGLLFFMLVLRYLKNKRLREQQQFVDTLLENTISYVVILDKDKQVKYVSPNYKNDFDDDKDINNIVEKIDKNDLPAIKEILKKIESGTIQKEYFECQIKNATGETICITGVFSNKLDNQFLQGILINFWDITRQKNYEKVLIENEEKFRSIFEAFPDIYFKIDINETLTMISPSVEKITGYKPVEIIGEKIIKFYVDDKEITKIRNDILLNQSVQDITVHLLKKDSTILICSLSAKICYDDNGKPIGYEGVTRDITERVEKERQLKEANETKDKLFSIIAHDLVGPIGMQKNMIDLLLSDIDAMSKEEMIPFLSSIKPALDATFFMIENLLSWARIMQQHIKPVFKNNNIYKSVEQVFDFLQVQAKQKEIKFMFKGDKNQKAFFDSNLIDIVLRNLITNAIKFSPKGTTITVATEKDEKYVNISVIDQGIGIPNDILNNLNSEKHKSTSRIGTNNEKGTGIGLIVVKEFISKHNSKLIIKSAVGNGSVFSFKLPISI